MGTLFSIGHSTRTLQEFVELLLAYGIERLVDVRTLPGSKRYPQFNGETLEAQLSRFSISYRHMKSLGGLRRPRADSQNSAWRNVSFRGYADYMQTEEFSKALARLCSSAERRRICIMCAEAVPWRCHRSLIADALLVRGFETIEILGLTQNRVHKLTPWGKIRGGRVYYPPQETLCPPDTQQRPLRQSKNLSRRRAE